MNLKKNMFINIVINNLMIVVKLKSNCGKHHREIVF